MLKLNRILSVVSIILAAMGVAHAQDSKKIRIVTTTTMITDMVEHIAGDHATVEGLMGPGVDPHLYKATAKDLQKLAQADLVFYNGLLLEGKMNETFENMAKRKIPVVIAISQHIPTSELIYPDGHEGHADPHIWFSPDLWVQCIPSVVEGLIKVDPAHKDDYEKAGAALRVQYLELDAWIRKRIDLISPKNRILVTSHDAFNYLGRAFGFEVIGVQGISTVTEAGLADMAHTEDMIKEKHVKAIFVESSVPHKTIERISKDTGAKIGGELFSDALGKPGEMEKGPDGQLYDLGTWEGMFKHNVNAIVEALR